MTIFKKEFRELLKSREIIITITITPVILAFFVPASMIGIIFVPEEEAEEGDPVPDIFRNIAPYWDELSNIQKITVLEANFFLISLIMIPMVLPMAISGDSIAGEKERKTIEGLLASPITEEEIFLGKALAAAVPSIIISWIAELIYITFIDIMLYNFIGGRIIFPNVFSLILFFLVMPSLTVLSTLIMTAVSSKARAVREAQQRGGLISLPLMMFTSTIIFLPLLIHPLLVLVSEILLVLIAILTLRIAIKRINREELISLAN